MNERSMCQCLILTCFVFLATDLCVLLHVIAQVSVQLHFLEVWQQYFFFLRGGVVSLTPNSQPEGPGYPLLSGSSPLTRLGWEALPVAYATVSIALVIIWPHKPCHYAEVGGHHTHAWYIFHSTHPHWFKHRNNTLWRMRHMKLIIVFSNLLVLSPS